MSSRCLAVGAAVLISIATTASAQDLPLPHYDIDSSCDKSATVEGSYSEQLKGTCMEVEQEAYDLLKDKWDNIPEAVKLECDREQSGDDVDPSYQMLKTCIDVEMDAAEKNKTREFRY